MSIGLILEAYWLVIVAIVMTPTLVMLFGLLMSGMPK
jgi:hypothetical protein